MLLSGRGLGLGCLGSFVSWDEVDLDEAPFCCLRAGAYILLSSAQQTSAAKAVWQAEGVQAASAATAASPEAGLAVAAAGQSR